MARVTTEEVKVIVPVPESVTDLSVYIDLASEMIDELIVAEYPNRFSDAWLKNMELWLAAHFTSCRYLRTSAEKIGAVSETYQHKVNLYFAYTVYGQQVLLLDTTGTFAELQDQATKGRRVASITWLGQGDSDADLA